ncbi:hypothetical protein Q0Z83_020720 [Actinoplanes sichuanensis]|uniref:Uncharacterized protein n=1 Tax=Actinoplanes sichuanensis TaxID=512349 RepID=A0ABW4AK26_9ACTN|nr:hypothetical protein [Actinoplanes sichuanensis]BEL03881.1 hypothetical protein Q0Z83_020720 [Actinoplanes sichuanensis]
MTRKIRTIGYWAGLGPAEPWPDVCAFVSDDVDHEAVAYLRAGTMIAVSGSSARCTLCGRSIGRRLLTDGDRYMWHEGLAHYVEEHGVRLPVRLVGVPAPFDAEGFDHSVSVDSDWWFGQRGRPVVDHLPGCHHSPVRCEWMLPAYADIWIDRVRPGDITTMARLRRLFGADWPFSGLRDRIAAQPFLVERNGRPAELNRVAELRDFLFYDTSEGLVSVIPDV